MRSFLPVLLALAACDVAYVAPDGAEGGQRVDEVQLPVEALFGPHDDTLTRELGQIRAVIDARAADPAAYDEGANPYRIRYAVYNLRNLQIVEALLEAHHAGVDVQVLLDDDQLDPARDYNWADEALVEGGFTFAPDHRELDEAQRSTTDLIGIGGSGLMHLKVRLYATPAGQTLITGSQNPGDNAMYNDETWHLVTDPALVARYDAAYDALLHEKGFDNTWDDASPWNVLFNPEASGPDAGTRTLEWLAEEDEQILLMVYSLRDITAPGFEQGLVDVLGERVAAGVPVVLITDRKQSDAWGDTTEDRLRDVGVAVYEATNATTDYTAMHHKVAVLGRTDIRVITDAANWSTSGLGSATKGSSNVESTLFLEPWGDDGHLGARYLATFVDVLQRYAHQSEADGELPADALLAQLMAAPGWPTVPVTFAVDEAHTAWGETVRVLGNRAALGAWGVTGPGVALGTDGDRYPSWRAPAPVDLLVGDTIAYKYVIEGSGTVRWEAGDDRSARVGPDAFVEGLDQELGGTWR